jgi:hypothetical protein
VIDLRERFGERYNVRWDEAKKAGGWTKEDHPWLLQIRGSSGFISLHTEDTLAVVVIGKVKSRELAKLAGIDLNLPKSQQTPRPGWRLLQFGDWELRCGFPIEEIDDVSKVIGARQRKPVTPEERDRLKRLASRRQKAPVAGA